VVVVDHIFDGKDLTKETAAFQLCDIEDLMLKKMIDDPNNMQEECNASLPLPPCAKSSSTQFLYIKKERDGWYTTQAYE